MAMVADGPFERSYAMRRRRLDARHDVEIDELAARERALEGALEDCLLYTSPSPRDA